MKRIAFTLMATLLCLATWAATLTDVFTPEAIGVTSESYTSWNGLSLTSSAIYTGNSALYNSCIELKSGGSTSGIVSTTSGGKVKSVSVTFNSITDNGRRIDVYGKDTAYELPSNLFNADTRGDLLGSITYQSNESSTQTLTITGDYEYIGIRSNSGYIDMDKIEITWEGEAPAVSVARPVIDVDNNDPYEGDVVTATITCETKGATIMYKLGEGAETTYTEPFTVTEKTTISAWAVADGAESAVVTKDIHFKKSVADINEMNQLPASTDFRLQGRATVVYNKSDYLYIKDDTGYALIYGSNSNAAPGNTIYNLKARTYDYNGLFMLTNATFDVDPTDTTVEPVEYTIDQITVGKMHHYAIIKGITLSAMDGVNFTMTDAEGNTLTGYDRRFVDYPQDLETTYDVEGFVGIYMSQAQFYPTKFTEHVDLQPVITVTPDFGTYEGTQTVMVTVENQPADSRIVYNFAAAEESASAPRKAPADIVWNEYDDNERIVIDKSGLLTIALLDAAGEEITSIEGDYVITSQATGIDTVGNKAIEAVRYHNVAGMSSHKPFSGLNIVVTTHADGTTTAAKAVF